MGKPVMSSFFDALWIITVMRDIRGTNIHNVQNVGVDTKIGADCVLPVFPHLKAPAQAAQEAQPSRGVGRNIGIGGAHAVPGCVDL